MAETLTLEEVFKQIKPVSGSDILEDAKQEYEKELIEKLVVDPTKDPTTWREPVLKAGPDYTPIREKISELDVKIPKTEMTLGEALEPFVKGAIGSKDTRIGVADVAPIAGTALAIDDVLYMQAREEAGLDVGTIEKYATYLGIPLSVLGDLTVAAGGTVAAAMLVDAIITGGKKTDKLIKWASQTISDFNPIKAKKILNNIEEAKKGISQGDEITPTYSPYSNRDKVITNLFDELNPIKVAEKHGASQLNVKPSFDAYRDMRLLYGERGVLDSMLQRGALVRTEKGVDFATDKGLYEVFAPIADDLENGMLYFALKRGKDLNARGVNNPFSKFSAKEIDEMTRKIAGKNKNIPKVFNEYQNFNQQSLKYAKDSGLLDDSTYNLLLEMGQNYVPFYRMFMANPGAKGGIPFLKGITGSPDQLADVGNNILKNQIMIYDLATKNHAKLGVYNMIQRYADEGVDMTAFAERLTEEEVKQLKKVKISAAGLKKKLDNLGIDFDLSKLENKEILELTELGRPKDLPPNIDIVFRNGKAEYWRIPKDNKSFFEALNAFGPKEGRFGLQLLSLPKRLLTRGVTLSPDFMLKNFARDTQAAFMQSKGNFIPIISSLDGLQTRIATNDNYWRYMANGGGFSTVYAGEKEMGKVLQDMYVNANINPKNVLNAPQKIFDHLENVSSSFETASRLGEFNILTKKNLKTDVDIWRDAAFAGRDVSTDFAMRGSNKFVNTLTASVPFLNARWQSLFKMARTAKENPLNLMIKGVVSQTTPSLMLYFKNREDPRYQALPDWVKDNHWVIGFDENNSAIIIPTGFEYGAVFKAMPERITEGFLEGWGPKDKRAIAEFLSRTMTETFAVPTKISDFQTFKIMESGLQVDVDEITRLKIEGEGKKWTGSPVIPPQLKGVDPEEQYEWYTAESLKKLTSYLNKKHGVALSPIQLENIWKGYTGTLGMYALQAADFIIGSQQPAKKSSEYIGARSFKYTDPYINTKYANDFYAMLNEANETVASANLLQKRAKQPVKLESEREGLRYDFKEELTGVNKQINAMKNLQTQIAEGLTDIQGKKQKREEIDRIQKDINQLLYDVMHGVYEQEERIGERLF